MAHISEKRKKIVVGMSGGVDSAVCAYLLKEQGHEVIGLFMKNWDDLNEQGECTAEQDYKDVASICEMLGIDYYGIEFIDEYRENVFNYFLEEYQAGHTPNPDILCNREIKFKVFFDHAMKLGADLLATGHYCQIGNKEEAPTLLKGKDSGKDQSYFLHTIKSDLLKKVIFPIGHLHKSEVREIAKQAGLIVSDKKDSTGICFIGERHFNRFLSQYVKSSTGEFQTLDGQVVGTHQGAVYFTPGQRKGLGLGGAGEPWYVIDKDMDTGTVYVERGHNHPALYRETLVAEEVSWVESPPKLPFRCKAKIRYRQLEQDCEVKDLGEGRLQVVFDLPQRAIAEGQSVVFYDGEICLGGGFIRGKGPSLLEQKKSLPEIISV